MKIWPKPYACPATGDVMYSNHDISHGIAQHLISADEELSLSSFTLATSSSTSTAGAAPVRRCVNVANVAMMQ